MREPRPIWTEQEELFLVQKYPFCNSRDVAEHLGKTHQAILVKAQRMGLKKEIMASAKKSTTLPGERHIATGVVSRKGNVTVHRMI